MSDTSLFNHIVIMLKGGYRPDEIASIIEAGKKQWGLSDFDIQDLEQMVRAIKYAKRL